ncbi:S-adenosyl-L-methionine-dependent methyltransferase [Corynespora cassiicola Philippines]|uniref:S-adenosyl-L-methionine-dependent methyltransferase n=1 Tax=Corynespora cassiicola Philippines TaxID=1448308 RepID=A0A2T2NB18_CORCC|nr:S-adenosyl-L-methionine-dependent methyltransferase [Corynespora cassiicola Philippines]
MACRTLFTSSRTRWRQRHIQNVWCRRKSSNARYKGPTWTESDLAPCEDYPLSSQLHASIKPEIQTKIKKVTTRFMRPQIVNPELCDDVLKYSGNLLEQHKGCDILDINPGAGVWSRKLHEFLQPRSHILVEPDPDTYKEHLDPLLNAPGSKYKLVAGDMCDYETITCVVDENTFPHQKRPSEHGVNPRTLNNTLLVTGTLAWSPKLPGFGFDSVAKQVVYHMSRYAWFNEGIHTFGPVRGLWWLTDEDMASFVPRSSFHQTKLGLFADQMNSWTQIVSGGHVHRYAGKGSTIGRDPESEMRSISLAIKSGREKGYELPTHRREDIHDFAEHIENISPSPARMGPEPVYDYLVEQQIHGKSPVGLLTGATADYYRLEKEAIDNPEKFYYDKEQRNGEEKRTLTKEGRNLSRLRAVYRQFIKRRVSYEEVSGFSVKMYQLECEILKMEDGPEKDAAIQQLDEYEDAYNKGISMLDSNVRSAVANMVDDRLSILSPIPRYQWDRRPFEPIVMRPNEVWPSTSLSLCITEPQPIPPGMGDDWYEWVEDFLHGLCTQTLQTDLLTALETMQHGASQIVNDVPVLFDPAKGGRLRLKHMKVRMLTREMIQELCRAYHDWPFRTPQANHHKYFRVKGKALSDRNGLE